MGELTTAGRFMRERFAQPDRERHPDDPIRHNPEYVPCAREHQPKRLCLKRAGDCATHPPAPRLRVPEAESEQEAGT